MGMQHHSRYQMTVWVSTMHHQNGLILEGAGGLEEGRGEGIAWWSGEGRGQDINLASGWMDAISTL